MNILRVQGLRNFLRSVGLVSLLKYPQHLRNQKRINFYKKNRLKEVTLNLDNTSFIMNIGNAYEWSRVNSFYDDKKILLSMSKNAKLDDTFWDVGTSIGLYSIYMSRKLPKGMVISYEPELRSKNRLQENIDSNEIKNIQIVELALGKEKGTFHLAIATSAEAGDHKILDADEKVDLEIQSVNVVTGDSLLTIENLPPPNIIKIDVEGQEENVLIGCKEIVNNNSCHTIIIEVHFSIFNERNDDNAVQRIINLLKESGFTNIIWIDPSHLAAYK